MPGELRSHEGIGGVASQKRQVEVRSCGTTSRKLLFDNRQGVGSPDTLAKQLLIRAFYFNLLHIAFG